MKGYLRIIKQIPDCSELVDYTRLYLQVWTTFWTRLQFVVTKFPQITRIERRTLN